MATDCLEKMPIRLKEPIEKISYSTETGEEQITWITEISVPCGKCARCLQRRKMEWSYRMMYELRQSKTAYFVTLTYDPGNVPYNQWGKKVLVKTRAEDIKYKKIEEGRKRVTKKWKSKLVDRSLQGFFKRLRRIQETSKPTIETIKNNLNKNDKLKFYAAGEYGEDKGRPHFHAIIFNASATNIDKAWQLGNTVILPATEATIMYTMKYLDKRLGNKPDKSKPEEFNIMSKGIGEGYVKDMKEWHRRNLEVGYVSTNGGIKIPMPRYYQEKIYDEQDKKERIILIRENLEQVKEEKIEEWGKHRYNEINSEARLESEIRFKKKIKKRIVD